MLFIEASIDAFKTMDANTMWKTVSGIYARVRRAAIGIMLCLGPFNYPFNETYATLIPALLAGNVVIMKIPTIGTTLHTTCLCIPGITCCLYMHMYMHMYITAISDSG